MPTPFETAYKDLNTEQKKAVDTIEGPVMVIAGPGTGKTQVLTLRIANILSKTDTQPQNILAVTYTDAAAINMRKRLVKLIGPIGYQVRMQTIHAFCDEVIRANPEYFPFARDAQAIDDVEQLHLIRSLLDDPTLTALRTPGSKYHYVKDIISVFSTLKREGITPLDFAKIVSDQTPQIAKHMELAKLYQKYQVILQSTARYDFDDMILSVKETFEAPDSVLLSLYQEQCQYILVDEYQDTNGAQNTIIDRLASFWGEDANIFVVGDPNQTIFRFQGASLHNTLGFLERYTKTTLITLDTGYRSTQLIYDTAAHLISHCVSKNKLSKSLQTTLRSTNKSDSVIELCEVSSTTYEDAYIAKRVGEYISFGVDPKEIAVLYKKNAEGKVLSEVFSKFAIPHEVERGHSIFDSLWIQEFVTLLAVIEQLKNNTDGREVFDLLNFSWIGLDALPIMVMTRILHRSKTAHTLFDLVMEGYDSFKKRTNTEVVTKESFGKIHDFFTLLSNLAKAESNLTFPQWIVEVMTETGFLPAVKILPNKHEVLSDVNAFFEDIKKASTSNHTMRLSEYLERIETMREHGLSPILSSLLTEQKVTLCTVHKAKGREWKIVFIAHGNESKWEKARAPNSIALPESMTTVDSTHTDHAAGLVNENRRLFYVALTRAQVDVIITYSTQETNGTKMKDLVPTQFIGELAQEKLTMVDTVPDTKEVSQILETLLRPAPAREFQNDVRLWLQSLVSDYELSVTSLNHYLHSPQEWFEQDLLRVPHAKAPHMAFGTAIHAALEYHFKNVKDSNGVHPQTEETLARFLSAMEKEIISDDDKTSRIAQGKKLLTRYLDEKRGVIIRPLATEESFGWKRGKVMLGDISLTGKIDRIDLLGEDSHTLRVIDYKTGKPRTHNEIEGKVGIGEFSERELSLPESVRGAYKRQLLFYKLLMGIDPMYKKYKVEQGVFDFVEAKDDKLIERSFILDDSHVDDLKKLIIEVMSEIRSLKFLEFL